MYQNENWLKSRFHFSFAEYNSRLNQNYGVIRVLNDDLVQPHRGFGTHPHGDMEIVTYIVDGKLTHQDSKGNKESLGRGSVQFMTAGTGIRHSEFNHDDKPLRFIQTWINPRTFGLKPNYGSFDGSSSSCQVKNEFRHLVSDVQTPSSAPVKINQDCDLHTAEIDLGQTITFELPESRQAYFVCLEGELEVNGHKLEKYDAAEIAVSGSGSGTLNVRATSVDDTENGKLAHVLMFVMKKVAGSGRADVQPQLQAR
jgi:quercetin 2,3-dioxygenase